MEEAGIQGHRCVDGKRPDDIENSLNLMKLKKSA
jgi:hypothetical protein